MKRARVGALVVALISSALIGENVIACSLGPDSKAQETNFELAREADVILVGSLVRSIGNDPFDSKLLVKPTYLVKGTALPKEAYIWGFLSDETIKLPDKEIRVIATKSSELDLWRPHPEVWIGGCSRQTFDRGMQLVLFFKRDGEKLNWLNPAFSRTSEDVSSRDALWVKAVKLYARISQLPLAEQKPALNAELLLLRKNSFLNRENTLLADDVERQLAGVRPVSDFDIDRSTSDERRWVENIVNESYHGQVAMPEDVPSQESTRKSPKLLWYIGGLLVVGAGIFAVALFRNRVRKPQ